MVVSISTSFKHIENFFKWLFIELPISLFARLTNLGPAGGKDDIDKKGMYESSDPEIQARADKLIEYMKSGKSVGRRLP